MALARRGNEIQKPEDVLREIGAIVNEEPIETRAALDAGDTVKLELCPDKGAAIAVLDQLRDIQSTPDGTELSFLNYVNSSSRHDGDWWGQDILLTATIGGIPTIRWLKFHDPEA